MPASGIEPGEFRDWITIEDPGDAAPGAFGDVTPDWTEVLACWAKVEPLRGVEIWRARQRVANATHLVTIRYTTTEITSRMRVVLGTQILEIGETPRDVDRRKVKMEFACTEEQPPRAGN